MPDGWQSLYVKLEQSATPEIRNLALGVGLIFGDEQALASLKRIATSSQQDAEQRRQAIETLVEQQAKGLAPTLIEWLDDKGVQLAAIRGLARYDAPQTGEELVKRFAQFDVEERQAAVSTLTTRPEYAHTLLAALSMQ